MFNVGQTFTSGFGSSQGVAAPVAAPAKPLPPKVVEASVDAPAKLASPSVTVQLSAQVNPSVVLAKDAATGPALEQRNVTYPGTTSDAAKVPSSNVSSVSSEQGSRSAGETPVSSGSQINVQPAIPSAASSAASNGVTPPKQSITDDVTPKEADSDSSTDPEDAAQKAQEEAERQEVQALKARDQEVRRHEQAHASAGGQYAGSPQYEYTTGPDGGRYATGGEVSIDTAPVAGDPEATLEKAQTVRRAALAPAEPSEQDRRVAAEASQMAAQARVELLQLQRSGQEENADGEPNNNGSPSVVNGDQKSTSPSKAEAEKEADAEAEPKDEGRTGAALLYSGDDEDGEPKADDAQAGVSARERFDQVYGSVSSVTQQLTAIANWEAMQPALENILDDIV